MTRIIRRRELCTLTGLSYSSIYRRIRRGTFPKAVALGDSGQAIGWYAHEVEAWMNNCRRRAVAGPDDACHLDSPAAAVTTP